MTDDWGRKLVTTLLPIILQASNMKCDVETCGQGTPHYVNFGLKVPSGEFFHFTGWPDFTITRSLYQCQKRLAGVGETQSRPGSTHKAKTAALAQGGIYGVGQLVHNNTSKMPVILVFKDKSAQVLIASTTSTASSTASTSASTSTTNPNIVQYEYVGGPFSISLKEVEGVQNFANYFVAAL